VTAAGSATVVCTLRRSRNPRMRCRRIPRRLFLWLTGVAQLSGDPYVPSWRARTARIRAARAASAASRAAAARRWPASSRNLTGRHSGSDTTASRRSVAGGQRRTGSGSPARRPGETAGRLPRDVAFFLQLTHPAPQRPRSRPRPALKTTGPGGRPSPANRPAHTLPLIIGADPPAQRPPIDTEIGRDLRDLRAWPRPIHPETSMAYRNVRLTLHGRRLLVRRVITYRRPVAHVVKELACPAPPPEGNAGLRDRPSVAHRLPSKTSAAPEAMICALRTRPKQGPRRLAWLRRPANPLRARTARRTHPDRRQRDRPAPRRRRTARPRPCPLRTPPRPEQHPRRLRID
jgi:hypothetical protein